MAVRNPWTEGADDLKVAPDPLSSWTPVDLTDALDGKEIAPPVRLERVDGVHMLYDARIHWFQGESESLKSWAAQLAVAQTLNMLLDVLYVDFEDSERSVVSRLLALGVGREIIARHLVYIRPDEPLIDSHDRATVGNALLGEVLAQEDRRWGLAVIDGVTEGMTTEGLDLLDNADAASWMRRLPKRITTTIGCPVICIDHVTKSSEGRGRYAIGAQHKLAGVDGAVYSFTTRASLSRALVDPVTGQSLIEIHKDRPGWVRSRALGKVVGILEITAYPDGGVTAAIVSNADSQGPPTALVVEILEYVRLYPGSSINGIEKAVKGNAETIRAALKWMADEPRHWLQVEMSGRTHRHFLTDEGEEWLP